MDTKRFISAIESITVTGNLSMNVSFHEIDAPRGLCKDVSGVGGWGNGIKAID